MDFLCAIGGIRSAGTQLRPFHNETGKVRNEILVPEVHDRLHIDKPVFGDDFAFLKSVTRATPKQSIPSPSILHSLGETERSGIYKDNDALLEDLTKVSGIPHTARRCGPGRADPSKAPLRNLINAILARKPDDMVVCVRTCRGNHRSAWVASGAVRQTATCR